MEATAPKFSIGEEVLIYPLYKRGHPQEGLKTRVIARRWSQHITDRTQHSGDKEWIWGYYTEINPMPYQDAQGCWCEPVGWAEYNLRKCYDAGEDFNTLISMLQEDLSIEEVECLSVSPPNSRFLKER